MLNITIPSTGPSRLTFTEFERYELPKPPNGIDAEINNDLILKFEDEEEAINYIWQLEDLSNSINDKSLTVNIAINDLILGIRNDEFVQGYQQ